MKPVYEKRKELEENPKIVADLLGKRRKSQSNRKTDSERSQRGNED